MYRITCVAKKKECFIIETFLLDFQITVGRLSVEVAPQQSFNNAK